ncbi:MAG: sigma-54 dependent transcriptional regulator [Vicinamibacteria bacterium]|nr:sigma-54 dependent transcriptional regulator [Vicinamibacteria bacterium]
MTASCPTPASAVAFRGVSMAFAALGRVFLCLDKDFHILHASELLDDMTAPGSAASLAGLPVEQVLGAELFGRGGSLRATLEGGERREGWRASLAVEGYEPRLVSVTAAPFPADPAGVCDPLVRYVVVLRPAEGDGGDADVTLFHGLVARSEAMLRLFRLVQTLEQSEVTVLITGESGTGKERLAHALHARSPRQGGPFVAVNCGALPGELLESELFGHVRGAFTGAVRDRVGRFELAAGGTLFLDEVGDLPLPLQVKLLRVLQERRFERVGESVSRVADVRVIAATNLDLARAVAEGRFRDDLYYRLRVVPIHVPPLRERREDVEPLANHLLARVAGRRGRALRLSPDALRCLIDARWRGNVREMENALEYAVAVCRGQTILPEDLPADVMCTGVDVPRAAVPVAPTPAPPTLRAVDETGPPDAEQLRAVLEAHRWRREEAAQELGISRSTLWRRMREAGLLH